MNKCFALAIGRKLLWKQMSTEAISPQVISGNRGPHFSISISCDIISATLNSPQDCWGKMVRVTHKPVDKSRIQASNIPGQRLPVTIPESDCSSLWKK